MIIEIPDDRLIQFCGGDWGNASSTDVGKVVHEFLGGSIANQQQRRIFMGEFLLDCLEAKLGKP